MSEQNPEHGKEVRPQAQAMPHPCRTEDDGFDHDWKFQDDSFDHEYGTQRVHYWMCERCGETKDMGPGDYDFDDE